MSRDQTANRRLAAILFADIVGYTAMMQSDEGQAMSRLERYQDVLKKHVSEFNGEIVKNYGDGSLCLFNSVLDSVNCAKDIQEELMKEPQVPLRIGLHLGDVMFKSNDIYGNDINIASRIESMGVPGSILMSKNIYEKVKNQSNLKFQSLGNFNFKNVEEAKEIFALTTQGLVIPKSEELEGKGKSVNSGKSTWLKYAALLIPVLLALGAIHYFSSNDSNQSAPDFDAITIFPFDVKGGEDIQYMGEAIVDLVSAKLDGIPGINPIDPNLIFSKLNEGEDITRQLAKASTLSNDFGASKFILGSITEINNSLQITASKYQNNGDVITKKSVEGNKDELVDLIDRLTKALIADQLIEEGQELSSLAASTSNNFNALSEYLHGEQAFRKGKIFDAYEHYVEATTLDSTFAMAWLRLRDAASWSPRTTTPGAIYKAQRYKDKIPQKWQDYIDAVVSYIKGDFRTERKYNNLINKYGETREFTNGLAEYLFHHNPSHGRSAVEAKPWLIKSREIDPGNQEALIHLSDIALMEGDSTMHYEIMMSMDIDADMWALVRYRYLSTLDTLTEEQILEVVNHPNFGRHDMEYFMAAPEDPIQFISLSDQFSPYISNQNNRPRFQGILNALQGKHKAGFENIRNNINRWNQNFPIIGFPAIMMTSDYQVLSEEYEYLFEFSKRFNNPQANYSAIKYCWALSKGQECDNLKNLLLQKTKVDSIAEEAKYFYHSVNAFEARNQDNDELALLEIDSAFIYSPGYWQSQYFSFDKSIIKADIHEERGEYEQAIAYFENIPRVHGYEFMQPYATYRLTQLYEKVGDVNHALSKCNLLLKSFKDCDDKFKPWVEEVSERRERLMSSLL